jgi:type II secretory pathway component PulK
VPDTVTSSGTPTHDGTRSRRRGFILPVVLLILALMGLMAAGFAFQVNAESAATQATIERMQTRLAAEAGFHYVTMMLRQNPLDVNAWYDNREQFRGVVVWSSAGGLSTFGPVEESEMDQESTLYEPVYRFSLVADDPEDDEINIRYGITDESAKLNINVADADQLTRLIEQVIPESGDAEQVPVDMLVDSLMDWRDPDDDVHSNGAEAAYYLALIEPYRCKNAPFDTVEELLMVRGFTGRILYGEDADRNGLLSPNEDDGDITFPADNEDGVLDRGLYPYVTVYSRDLNRANDNRPRALLTGGDDVRERLEEHFESDEVGYLLSGRGEQGGSLTEYLDVASNGDASPFSVDEFPSIVDRCTLDPSPELVGRINVNTAPRQVLRCLTPLADEEIAAIVQKRVDLSSDTKATTAWLLTEGVLSVEQYEAVEPMITARGLQFTVESIGYADHLGLRYRLQVIFQMRGPVPQIMYYRDLTNVGTTFPLLREEEESGGFADGPRGKTTDQR